MDEIKQLKKITKEELGDVIRKHMLWLNKFASKQIDLDDVSVRADLRRSDLSRFDLREVDLSRAYLNEADLSGADLRGAFLHQTFLFEANLCDADLVNADLSSAQLRQANLVEAHLIEANLRKANLRGASLIEANLIDANLSGSILIEADLRHANLRGADLSEANLSDTDLRGVNLSGANLSKANLTNVNLSGTDLSGVNFDSVDLRGTVFIDSILKSSNFNNSHIDNCVFAGLDFSTVKGLETVKHHGPSSLDHQSLQKSKGVIPERFLKGCGFQDWEVENAKLYLEDITPLMCTDILSTIHRLRFDNPITYFSVYISYSHEDVVFADALHDALQSEGIRCWLDKDQMCVGDDIYDKIADGIKHCDKLLLCCSKSSLTEKWWVNFEINQAFEKERKWMLKHRKKAAILIPLNIDGYLFSHECDNPMKDEITKRLAAEFVGWENSQELFNNSVSEVVKALHASAEAP